jgi:endoglucanase
VADEPVKHAQKKSLTSLFFARNRVKLGSVNRVARLKTSSLTPHSYPAYLAIDFSLEVFHETILNDLRFERFHSPSYKIDRFIFQEIVMDESSLHFFRQLLETPSPSGYEQPVQKLIREWAGEFADEVRTDVHGNVIATLNPSGKPRILLDGHCDQIGMMVQYIDDNGFLYCLPIGGWDVQILLGQKVTVWSAGGPIPGVIARKATHLLTEDERRKIPEFHELWIDIGATNGEEARGLVAIGDPATCELGMRTIRGQLVSGVKMDNTSGLFVVFEALKRLKGRKIDASVHVVSAVQEEIGLRGAQTAAYGVDPNLAIAVDVTHATDCPTIDKRSNAVVGLGKGPVLFRGPNINPVMFRRIQEISKEKTLPVQIKGANRGTSNDTNVIQLVRGGVGTACLGIPNRYMHSPVEMISLTDLDTAASLIAAFVESVRTGDDFTP